MPAGFRGMLSSVGGIAQAMGNKNKPHPIFQASLSDQVIPRKGLGLIKKLDAGLVFPLS
jgi:hypothetical protein